MKKKINLCLDEEVIKAVKKLAKARHSNFSATINQLLWAKINGSAGEYIADTIEELAKKLEPSLRKLRDKAKDGT